MSGVILVSLWFCHTGRDACGMTAICHLVEVSLLWYITERDAYGMTD
jgi:hypothetical protein